MLRPLGPSGEDCNESVAGLAVDEVPLGVAAEAGVTVNGTDVLMYCLRVGCADGVGDGQHLLPNVEFGEEDIPAGAISGLLGRLFTGPLRVRGGSKFPYRFESFRRVVLEKA